MGWMSSYCSSAPNILMKKDKIYTVTIISNILTNPMSSYKTNNKFLSIHSARQQNENLENTYSQSNPRQYYSNKELKIPENPLPFVKTKPKPQKKLKILFFYFIILMYYKNMFIYLKWYANKIELLDIIKLYSKIIKNFFANFLHIKLCIYNFIYFIWQNFS